MDGLYLEGCIQDVECVLGWLSAYHIPLKDIRKITTWIERSKLDDEQTPYYAEMKLLLQENAPYIDEYPIESLKYINYLVN